MQMAIHSIRKKSSQMQVVTLSIRKRTSQKIVKKKV